MMADFDLMKISNSETDKPKPEMYNYYFGREEKTQNPRNVGRESPQEYKDKNEFQENPNLKDYNVIPCQINLNSQIHMPKNINMNMNIYQGGEVNKQTISFENDDKYMSQGSYQENMPKFGKGEFPNSNKLGGGPMEFTGQGIQGKEYNTYDMKEMKGGDKEFKDLINKNRNTNQLNSYYGGGISINDDSHNFQKLNIANIQEFVPKKSNFHFLKVKS